MSLTSGSRLGPYEIVEPLGAGGMGEVYRARDPRLGRDVAVKVLEAGGAADPDRLRRFASEARAVAALSHPHVLAIYDVGIGGTPYLVTELLEGETLRALLQRGPLTPARTVQLALQLAAGLAAAHARGIVHRDLKPENLFITRDGHLKILDFGLAKRSAIADAESTAETGTAPHVVLGTLHYMAPEQLRGGAVDQCADIFACGAVLFEMATGRRAFAGASPADTVSAILTVDPAALTADAGLPPGLAAIVRRCLDPVPARRYPRAGDLGAALESLSDVGSGAAAAPSPAGLSSIAVLPFTNLSADVENQYFSDGLSEDLLNALARVPALRVASQTASFRFRSPDRDVADAARALGVDGVLEGSVRRSGQRLRVTARLTSCPDGVQAWSGRYDRELVDVFELQDEIVEAIVAAVGAAVSRPPQATPRRSTENLEAYELYLKGRYFWNQRSPAVIAQAIRCFEHAIALDPGYALAHAGLADCYSVLRVYGWTPLEHCQPRALEAVTTALALDPELPEAHLAKALYTFHFERHWRAARPHFDEALARRPRVGLFHAHLGMFLATAYAWDEARRALDRALELDAYSSHVHFLVAASACALGDAPLAERHARRALELEPQSLAPRWPLTVSLLMADRIDEAVTAAEQVLARARAPLYVGVMAMVYGRAGRVDDVRRLTRELTERQGRGEHIAPTARLAAALGAGERDAIAHALSECADGGAAPFPVVAPARWILDGLRGDAGIDRLLDRLLDGARPDARSAADRGGPARG